MDTDLASTSAARTGARRRSPASPLPTTLDALFHPAVANWFAESFASPTPAQAEAWPAIKAGRHTLIAAPTGSGKTLAAFMSAIDDLVRQGLEAPLADETQVVYVSPLKALSNDIQHNLEAPLAGIRGAASPLRLPDVEIRTWVRTGDTPVAEREQMRRRPPHILVTTPESLYVLLGSESGREMLASARSVIVDEIHAVAPQQARRASGAVAGEACGFCGDRLQRIGLSAHPEPDRRVAAFSRQRRRRPASRARLRSSIRDISRQRDFNLEVPGSPLEAVMSNEVWTRSMIALTELIKSIARRSSSSIRGAWPNAWRVN